MRRFILVVVFLFIYACGGSGGGGWLNADNITATWDHRGLDTNGNLDSLDAFMIWWGTESGNYMESVLVPLGMSACSTNATYPFSGCSYEFIRNAPPAIYYVTVQTIDVMGNISANGIEASIEVTPPDIASPVRAENIRLRVN